MDPEQKVAVNQEPLPNFQFQAMMEEMRRLVRHEFDQIHERLDKKKESQKSRSPTRSRRDNYSNEESEEDEGPRWRRGRHREDDNLRSIKMKVPSFQGKSNPDAYIEWEKRMESLFDVHEFSDLKKVKLVVTEFFDYALT